MGKIIAICTSEKKGTKKFEVETIQLIKDFGLEGDAHGGNWHRQISFLDKHQIDLFNERGGNVTYGDFGENIVTEGIDYTKLEIGSKLRLNNCVAQITQFGKQCHNKCEIFYRVGECIMPQLGVFAKVIEGGHIKLLDEIQVL